MTASQSLSEYRREIDDLDRAILTLAGRINAATYELLVLVREFDERAGWLKWGFDHCAEWLHWRCDLSLSAAREKVRVAHALKDLACMSTAFAKGELSYSKVRALTRVATPFNEASLCDFAMTTTAACVEERCRQLRNVQPESTDEATRLYARRSLSIWRNVERGMMTITVELPIEQGELVSQALDKAVEQDVPGGPELSSETWRAQQADALVSIAMNHLNGGGSGDGAGGAGCVADNYQVMIHVDESALTSGEGRSDLPIESVRRLTCDGSVIGVVETEDGIDETDTSAEGLLQPGAAVVDRPTQDAGASAEVCIQEENTAGECLIQHGRVSAEGLSRYREPGKADQSDAPFTQGRAIANGKTIREPPASYCGSSEAAHTFG